MPLLLTLTTGTGISETIALKYTDVDFTLKILYIDKQLGRSIDHEGENGSLPST
ncbi:MAG: hypothetical protein Q4F21_06680 [Lachnospiraceae bacterium]|nr:hypothetical protein [Lachnospiraceae bacterium]